MKLPARKGTQHESDRVKNPVLVDFILPDNRLCSHRTDHQYAPLQHRAGTAGSAIGSRLAKLDTLKLTAKTVAIDFYRSYTRQGLCERIFYSLVAVPAGADYFRC